MEGKEPQEAKLVGLPQPILVTVEDLFEMPEDGNRYELIDGRLHVTPPPTTRHQRVVMQVILRLAAWSEAQNRGKWFFAPCGVILDDTTMFQPDAFFVSRERVAEIVQEKAVYGAPDLIVEVLSPGTARRDRTVKTLAYASSGVREYWLIAPDAACVTVLTLVGARYEELGLVSGARTIPSRVLPDLAVRAEELFEY
ncbi:MAG: Uma2 family endonuclease [Candidatus Riflebacteria bacterium]|nr:Uma2 family endonuclease [Candidatus Riflebacteria bacterium]